MEIVAPDTMVERVARRLFERRYSGKLDAFTQKVLYGGLLTYDQVREGMAAGRIVEGALDDLHADARAAIDEMGSYLEEAVGSERVRGLFSR